MTLWLISQRYELKANHNGQACLVIWNSVVVNKSKIRIESKSQLIASDPSIEDSCG